MKVLSESSSRGRQRQHGRRKCVGRRIRKVAHLQSDVLSQSLLAGIGKEQLFAANLVGGDRLLAGRRDDPVDELLAGFLLYLRMPGRIDQHDAILIEEALVTLHKNGELLAVLERKPSAAV